MKQMNRWHKILDLFGARLKLKNDKFELDDEQINTGTITVSASNVDSGEETSGKVMTANGEGGASWEPIPDTKASDVDSESATSGQVLTADGNGGASWQDPSGGDKIYKHFIKLNASLAPLIYLVIYSKKSTPFTTYAEIKTEINGTDTTPYQKTPVSGKYESAGHAYPLSYFTWNASGELYYIGDNFTEVYISTSGKTWVITDTVVEL